MELKPCPFCGSHIIEAHGPVTIHKVDGSKSAYTYAVVKCSACGANGPHIYGTGTPEDEVKEMSITGWNNRKGG